MRCLPKYLYSCSKRERETESFGMSHMKGRENHLIIETRIVNMYHRKRILLACAVVAAAAMLVAAEEDPDVLKSAPIEVSEDGEQVFVDPAGLPDHAKTRDVEKGKLSFKPPRLNEEQERSVLIPEDMKCDACLAVAFQLHKSFQRAHKHFKDRSKRLSEHQVLDLTEQTCNQNTFSQYGLAPRVEGMEGMNRLKGPGVYDEPGVAQMGGRTPNRLAEVCGVAVGESDDMRIYSQWVTNGRSHDALKYFLCWDETQFCKEKSRLQETDLPTLEKAQKEKEARENDEL